MGWQGPPAAHRGVPLWGGGTRACGDKGGRGSTKGDVGGGNAHAATDRNSGPKGPWTKPPTIVDDEGYELVQRRKVRGEKGGPKADAHGPGDDGGECVGATTNSARRRWSDVDDDSDDGDMLDDDGAEDEDEGNDATGGDEGPDPARLRATFEAHARAVREMERRGAYGPALETLRSARDEAERRWREAKLPAPLPKRLDWADTKLRKAQAALTRVRLELDEFDAETDRRRADLCRRIQEAQQWYDWRRRQLDDLHEEAADMAPGRRAAAAGAGGTVEARKKIRGHVLPEMQAILEEVQEGTPLHGRLALVLAGLADAEAGLGDPGDQDGPQTYHMGDEDSQYDEWEQGSQGLADAHGAREDGQEGTCQGGRPSGWRPEGAGRWARKNGPKGGDVQTGLSGGETQTARAVQHASDGRRSGSDERAQGSSGAPVSTRDGSAARGSDSSPAREESADGAERAGKHRRRQSEEEARAEERAASDARRARELQEQLENATAVQTASYAQGSGGFGSEAALSAAAQSFVLEVQRAQAQASEMGVEARAADGRSLLELSPSELQQWVQEYLGGDSMRD